MNSNTNPSENGVTRRHFLVSTSLAAATLGTQCVTGMRVVTEESSSRTDALEKLPAQLLVLNEKGTVAAKNDDACAKNPWYIAVPATGLAFDQCDSVTLFLGVGRTSFRITPSSGRARIPTP